MELTRLVILKFTCDLGDEVLLYGHSKPISQGTAPDFTLLFQLIHSISISSIYLSAKHESEKGEARNSCFYITKDVLGNPEP